MGGKPVRLDKAIFEYFRADVRRQGAEGTAAQHRRTLDVLVRICGEGIPVNRLTPKMFEDVIDLLRKPADEVEYRAAKARGRSPRRGRSETTLNVDRSALRSFVEFLHTYGYLTRDINPAAGLKTARRGRTQAGKRAPIRDRHAVLQLLDLAGERHPRDRAAIALGVLAGMRESEILELRWRDIEWFSSDVPQMDFFRPKGRDAHQVALNQMLEFELRSWHAFYAERHPEMLPSWYVIPARQRGYNPSGKGGHTLCPDWPIVPHRKSTRISRPIKPLFARVGITDLTGKGMHTLRRTFANTLLEDTGDIRVVQRALGHVSQATTEQYLDRTREFQETAQIMRAWNPYGDVRRYGDNVRPLRRRSA